MGIAILALGLALAGFVCIVYRWFNHSRWTPGSIPDYQAKITNVSQQHIELGRRNMDKLKTTVSFSDGFRFITYKTKYEMLDGIINRRYRMYIDTDEVINSAKRVHDKAVKRKLK